MRLYIVTGKLTDSSYILCKNMLTYQCFKLCGIKVLGDLKQYDIYSVFIDDVVWQATNEVGQFDK